MSVKISLRFIYENEKKFDIASLEEALPFCRISQNIKGTSLLKGFNYAVKKSNLCISDIIKRTEIYDEDKIKDCVRKVFNFIDKNGAELNKEFCISFVSDNDQFGLNVSNDLLNFLSGYNFAIRISGVFVWSVRFCMLNS